MISIKLINDHFNIFLIKKHLTFAENVPAI
jgi:hypothetical protein